MKVAGQPDSTMGVRVEDFDLYDFHESDVAQLRKLLYANKIVVLRAQLPSPAELVELCALFGRIERRREFVRDSWCSENQHTPYPFAISIACSPAELAPSRRIHFIDQGKAYCRLPESFRRLLAGACAVHTPPRPTQPLATVRHPAVIVHPCTGEHILYLSAGCTVDIEDHEGMSLGTKTVRTLLELSGQLDASLTHDLVHHQILTRGDVLIWDNRSLVHRFSAQQIPKSVVIQRFAVYDEYPFDAATIARRRIGEAIS
ncbi:TauD/TfdA family dioxygenase [Nocardia sp. CDC159]|uniref:TauD/TfdA family dioxygenase n=1 Tax=Nocardia pulmonis TaxID=2951408 RepID=A0A9X2EA28_9NOCA|nr:MULTISPECIES: TauD/TfdA family dioxygenase [Nocardia]MCM6774556.1 TauD/TfdA family dioxygenase [Nocardia pulmonis]MCM6787379.1 TauD/TfdA family dioxygenase [Nocardia sp. CDC159]